MAKIGESKAQKALSRKREAGRAKRTQSELAAAVNLLLKSEYVYSTRSIQRWLKQYPLSPSASDQELAAWVQEVFSKRAASIYRRKDWNGSKTAFLMLRVYEYCGRVIPERVLSRMLKQHPLDLPATPEQVRQWWDENSFCGESVQQVLKRWDGMAKRLGRSLCDLMLLMERRLQVSTSPQVLQTSQPPMPTVIVPPDGAPQTDASTPPTEAFDQREGGGT